MDNYLEENKQNLAKNLIELRKIRNLSQARLAEASGVPRSTLANLESGSANPSLSLLITLAQCLKINLDELLAKPRYETQVIKADHLKREVLNKQKIQSIHLLIDPIPGLNVDRMDFPPQSTYRGTAHLKGTKEYFYLLLGKMTLIISGKKYSLSKGDLVIFDGDQNHSYCNLSERPASGLAIVCIKH
jgi:transcriptional regulator with XRE-family HTH domain